LRKQIQQREEKQMQAHEKMMKIVDISTTDLWSRVSDDDIRKYSGEKSVKNVINVMDAKMRIKKENRKVVYPYVFIYVDLAMELFLHMEYPLLLEADTGESYLVVKLRTLPDERNCVFITCIVFEVVEQEKYEKNDPKLMSRLPVNILSNSPNVVQEMLLKCVLEKYFFDVMTINIKN
jgi:hypothetical protein